MTMLEKTRRSGLLNAFVFMLTTMVLYGTVNMLFNPPDRYEPALPWQNLVVAVLLVVFALVAGVIVWVFSRSDLVIGLGTRGFGAAGLARWALLGLLSGASAGLLHQTLLIWPGESSRYFYLFEWLFMGLFFILGYWIIFRRNPIHSTSTAAAGKILSPKDIERSLVVIGALFAAFAILVIVFLPEPRELRPYAMLIGSLAVLALGLNLIYKVPRPWGLWLVIANVLLLVAGLALGIFVIVKDLILGK
jgi:cbb3-type cytochrome oxidase subunit 3